MTTPDSRIDPNKNLSVNSTSASDQKRKPPLRDFEEVADQIDERRNFGDEEEGAQSQVKKKSQATQHFGLGHKKAELQPSKMLSPFDLAAKRGNEDEDGEDSPQDDDAKMAVQASKGKMKPALAKSLNTKEPAAFEVDDSPKTKKPVQFRGVEQHDLAAVNPNMQQPAGTPLVAFADSIAADTARPPLNVRSMQEIIDQIVKEAYTLEQSGKTETVISLKGTFEGSHLIITQFNSDAKSLNITIDNLTQQGQQLLNMNKNALINDLASKQQITVHIFTATTTNIEPTTFANANDGSRDQNDSRQGGSSQREKRNKDQS